MKLSRTVLVLAIILLAGACLPGAAVADGNVLLDATYDGDGNLLGGEFADDTDTIVNVNFPGVWVTFETYASQLMVPSNWVAYTIPDDMNNAGVFFYAGTNDGTQTLKLQYVPTDMYDLYEVADLLADSPDYSSVGVESYNGVAYLSYELPDADSFGSYTLAGDGRGLFNFIFSPIDVQFSALSRQIMVTMSDLDYAGLEAVG